ncbi:MAG: acyltransferase [Acidimicrobiales bacterium]
MGRAIVVGRITSEDVAPGTTPARSIPYLPALTGLRMVAAALVYLRHVPQPSGLNPTVATFMSAGYAGVSMFFVLSGFVLGVNYFDRLSSPTVRGTWNYVVARVARIYPLYIAVLLFVVVRTEAAGGGPLSGLGLHVAGLQAWSSSLEIVGGFNAPAWSLSVELFLYACFPALVLIVRPLRRPAALVAGLASVVGLAAIAAYSFIRSGHDFLYYPYPESAYRWLYFMPIGRLGDFTAGILLARLYQQLGDHPTATRTARWVALGGAATMALLMSSPAHLHSAWSWDASYLVPTLAIIWGLAASGPRSWLASKPMVAAGTASYAFYLIHTQVMGELGARKFAAADLNAWVIASQVMTFLLVLALAIGLCRMIEQPARRWIRRHAST